MTKPVEAFGELGFQSLPSRLPEPLLDGLAEALFTPDQAGTRCLLGHELVREAACHIRRELTTHGFLGSDSVAIQAIAFDKTASTNWKVAWHQDLMFPLAREANSTGYGASCLKDGIPFSRPPVDILNRLTAVRLSLDPCGPDNGPLRVLPGTHRFGVISTAEIPQHVAAGEESPCLNHRGDLLLMKPLLLHASSQASLPSHRRILHLVFDEGPPPAEPWHQLC